MTDQRDENAGEIPLSWFGKTLWKYTPLYIELVFLAICLRLIGLVEPFVFQVIIDRILPFQREASLMVVVAIFVAVSLFQLVFEVLSDLLGMITGRALRSNGPRGHPPGIRSGSLSRLRPSCDERCELHHPIARQAIRRMPEREQFRVAWSTVTPRSTRISSRSR